MSTPARRPPAAGRDSPAASSRTPRASTPNSGDRAGTGTASPPGSVARTRSVRSSTLVGARAAMQRRESLLSGATSAHASPAVAEAQEAARAETVALLDDLRERLSKAEGLAEQYRRQGEVQQAKLDEALKEHAKLEEHAHEYDEQTETLKNEKRDMARQMQQMEAIYEAERSAMTREKEDMANREEEMQAIIQRLKDSLAQRATTSEEEARPSRHSNNNSPSLDGGSFAPPSSLHRSDSRNNSKLLLQKDKLIESLRLELAEAQIKLVESENQGGGRLHEVERQLMEARMANARLMEDNESYQLLLQEKTLKGDFGTADFGFSGGADTHSRPRSSNQDALSALEGRGGSLADELSEATENETEASIEVQRRLEAELKSLQDQNKALTLYINKIIERLLEHQEYQYILDKSSDGKPPPPPLPLGANKDLPPPPHPSSQQPGAIQSFLQRTKSMAVGGSAANRPRPRPMSYMPHTALNHPETAPSIPISLARSTSVRRARPMSEQYTGSSASAASVVNAMYKGPDGPLSPSLRGSQAFFGGVPNTNGTNGSISGGQRSPGLPSSGNFPGMKSETSSVSGDSVAAASGIATSDSASSPPPASTSSQQSPPRHHEKTAFTGTKPRPLRLVQENPDSVKPDNRRASWIGWAFGKKDELGSAPPATLTGGETIRE